MPLYLCGLSAVEYWSRERELNARPNTYLVDVLGRPLCNALPNARVRKVHGDPPTDEQVRQALRGVFHGLTHPLHLLVSEPNRRRRTRLAHCHVLSRPVPHGAFVQVDQDIYVSAPAFCFVQMTSSLSIVRLVQLGNELCGVYTPSEFSVTGLLHCPPLVTHDALVSFIERAGYLDGAAKARRAAHYVTPNSASPMETISVMRISLPRKMGGGGIPAPDMNGSVDTPLSEQALHRGGYVLCDMLWKKQQFAVEYNGFGSHVTEAGFERDNTRYNGLMAAGISTLTITKRQISNFTSFMTVLKQIARRLNWQLGLNRIPDWEARAHSLRDELALTRSTAGQYLIDLLRKGAA